MNNPDKTETVNKPIGYIVGFVCLVISMALTLLSVLLISKFGDKPGSDRIETFVILFSVAISFALFFGVIAFRIFISQMTNQRELMSVRGWRLLAIVFFLVGIICSIFSNWLALLLPGAIALFCLWKEERFIKILRAARLIP